METIRKYYTFSLLFTAVCFALAGWYGWSSTGSVSATLGILWIVIVLSILEVSLSFDNAVVNAPVLRDMDPVWQQRFLTIGILMGHRSLRTTQGYLHLTEPVRRALGEVVQSLHVAPGK